VGRKEEHDPWRTPDLALAVRTAAVVAEDYPDMSVQFTVPAVGPVRTRAH